MSKQEELPEKLLNILKSVTNKRARVVIDHILEHGFITTEELEKKYGYSHPPRAARDVREQGIPLTTFRVKSSDGRTIAAYKFGDLSKIQKGRLGGRKVFSKKFKYDLYKAHDSKCAICAGHFEPRYLQIDHRIPYEIAGDQQNLERDLADYMLVCGSCNRKKSWSCENCSNWATKSAKTCAQCYWAYPQNYTHIALRTIRRTEVVWNEGEVTTYEQLKDAAQESDLLIPEYVKKVIAAHFTEDKEE